jgi:hemerythrin
VRRSAQVRGRPADPLREETNIHRGPEKAEDPTMSNFFEWDSAKLALGVREMDLEHQTLIGMMNKLHALHQSNAATPVVAKALTEFANFTVKHFADEEAYMERIGYPELRIHAGVHKTLLARVTEFNLVFQRTGKLTDEFFMFLKTWLKAHICGVDARYAKHRPQAA